MLRTTTPRTDAADEAEQRWRDFYGGLMAALSREDMPGAMKQVEGAAEAVRAYLGSAGDTAERERRARQINAELEAARRSAIATREHLRQQVLTVKPTAAYAAQSDSAPERWSTSL